MKVECVPLMWLRGGRAAPQAAWLRLGGMRAPTGAAPGGAARALERAPQAPQPWRHSLCASLPAS